MEEEPDRYRDRFADLRTSLSGEVERGMGFVEELMKELETTKTALRHTKLDLDNESEARRRLQLEVQEGKALLERQGRRPCIVALINADADCHVFNDQLIANGRDGGKKAADNLLVELHKFVRARGLAGGPNEMDIVVRAFANVSGLGDALELDEKQNRRQLRAFTSGFSGRISFFDFIDVGPSKDRADEKIRENIVFFFDRFQCNHLLLACGQDNRYVPFLRQYVGNKHDAERITLVEGGPLPAKMRDLGLKTTRFPSVFSDVAQPAAPTLARPGPSWARVVTSAAPETFDHRAGTPGRPATAGPADLGVAAGHNAQAQSDRPEPVLTETGEPLHDRRSRSTPLFRVGDLVDARAAFGMPRRVPDTVATVLGSNHSPRYTLRSHSGVFTEDDLEFRELLL